MSVFSTNQARHLYVATKLGTVDASTGRMKETDLGAILPTADESKNHLYFEYMGNGGLTRSDLIDIKNILYAKATDASKMARNLKKATVTFNGTPVKGEDYILKIAIRQFAGMSDEDIYTKFGMVHATDGMTVSEFYKELALSLAKNFSRELTKLFKFALTSGSGESVTETVVDEATKAASLTGTYTSLVITEVEQEWTLGIKPQVPVYFDVLAGDWGSVKAENSAEVVGNGKNIADLEYFCMGERGDIYRGVGYPNNIKTTYMVDASKTYSVLDIHYAYVGSNESVQKSEKTITIVCDNKTTLNSIIGAVKTATGLGIATL
jgi:hypothetical protein